MNQRHHIATVVLNYNSTADVEVLLLQLLAQRGVRHTVILVDNASIAVEEQRLRAAFAELCPQGLVGTTAEFDAHASTQLEKASAYLVLNQENRGYSAGNNIGIRLADALGADAVLIANPDMRIDDKNYIVKLALALFADEKNYITASRILSLDGSDENPMREPTFWEEALWFSRLLGLRSAQASKVIDIDPILDSSVPKVSGCCMLLRSAFLENIGYLDEATFLYCEEPILSSQVREFSGQIVFTPSLEAVHAHFKDEKGHSSKRMLLYIKSRKYYLKKYSGYSRFQLSILSISYSLLSFCHHLLIINEKLREISGRMSTLVKSWTRWLIT